MSVVDYFLYFPAESASRAAERLGNDGFETAIQPVPNQPDRRLVLAKKELEPSEDVDQVEERLYAFAEEFGGDYDGYER
jgi:hypothetical protein